MRRLLTAEVRRHRPDIVITGNFRDTWGGAQPQPGRPHRRRQGGRSTRCATPATAGSSPSSSTGEPRALGRRTGGVGVRLPAAPTHAVDTTDTFDAGVESLKAHAAYIDGLGWENWDPRRVPRGDGPRHRPAARRRLRRAVRGVPDGLGRLELGSARIPVQHAELVALGSASTVNPSSPVCPTSARVAPRPSSRSTSRLDVAVLGPQVEVQPHLLRLAPSTGCSQIVGTDLGASVGRVELRAPVVADVGPHPEGLGPELRLPVHVVDVEGELGDASNHAGPLPAITPRHTSKSFLVVTPRGHPSRQPGTGGSRSVLSTKCRGWRQSSTGCDSGIVRLETRRIPFHTRGSGTKCCRWSVLG